MLTKEQAARRMRFAEELEEAAGHVLLALALLLIPSARWPPMQDLFGAFVVMLVVAFAMELVAQEYRERMTCAAGECECECSEWITLTNTFTGFELSAKSTTVVYEER